MRATITALFLLFITGCGHPRQTIDSIGQFHQSLLTAGWHDAAFHPVDTTTLEDSGVREAGMIVYGNLKLEVYLAFDAATVAPVAGFFADSGLTVYVRDRLVVIVPDEKGAVSVIRTLDKMGFSLFSGNSKQSSSE